MSLSHCQKCSTSAADVDKMYHAALAKQGIQYETIEKKLLGSTLRFSSIEDAYACGISLLASGEGKRPISSAPDMIIILRICGVTLNNIICFKVSGLKAKGADVFSTLDLFLCGISAKRKYHVGICSKHEEIYVIVHD